MAKGYNPADAHRKAEKKKAAKKNKEQRQSAKEASDVKRGTGSLEKEIRELSSKERNGTLSSTERADLDGAKTELARLRKVKDDYAKAHPEQREAAQANAAKQHTVGELAQSVTVQGVQISLKQKREAEAQGLRFDKKGRLLNPEKSAYYDKTFNPFGVPPPGMPYRARPPTAEEIAEMQAAAEESSDEDDIPLPSGPRPDGMSGSDAEDSDDSDDTPMPEGPPPLPPGPPPGSFHSALQPAQPAQAHFGYPAPFPAASIHALPQSSIAPPQPHIQAGPSLAAPPLPSPPNASETATPIAGPSTSTLPEKPKASITISAGPQVRDLKKEALSFAPTALKRKRPTASGSTTQAKKIATDPSSARNAGGVAFPPGMALPPGFGPGPSTARAIPPGFGPASTVQVEDDAEEEEDDYDIQGPAISAPGSYAPLPGFEDEDEGQDQGPAMLPHSSYAPLPGYDDEEEEGDDQGAALPPVGFSSTLPDMEGEQEEKADQQGVALPPAGFQSTLPGYGSDEEQDE